jgi:L(+)-tartrate dehydratase beta subunit
MSTPTLDDVKMDKVHLKCPVDLKDLQQLKLGDLVYLDGPLFTGREGVYKRFLTEGVEPPLPWSEISNVNFHCSPAATQREDGSYDVKAVTATASFRFGKWMPEFLERTGVKIILGKGGMSAQDYKQTLVPQQAIYLTTVGYGLGATYGRGIRAVKDVYWLKELGIAQAMWVLDCDQMGPFIVESDAEGNSLFELCNQQINKNLPGLYEGLPQPALRRFGEVIDREEELL